MTPAKQVNGDGSIYFRTSDSRWVAALSLPAPDYGKPRRVVRSVPNVGTERQQKAAVKAKLIELRNERDLHGDIQTSALTVETWARAWLNGIASKEVRPKTAASYRTTVERYIIPSIGRKQIKKLTPDDVRNMVQFVTDRGLSTRSAALTYQVLSLILEAALREGKAQRNVCKLVNRPRTKKTELAVLTAADGMKVLQAVTGWPPPLAVDRLASRWWAALFTGARQGELLGLTWDRVDFNRNTIELSWQLQRLTWEHGCKTPCGFKRGNECPKRTLTAPADWEHHHLTGGLYLSRPKSEAGVRIVPLVSPLLEMMQMRQRASVLERNPHGLVWTQPSGAPIDPSRDNKAWHELLAMAGAPDARLHAARHTAASLLGSAGVPIETITKILGHSTYAMSREYMTVDYEQMAAAMTRAAAPMLEAQPAIRL
jgi:integrase